MNTQQMNSCFCLQRRWSIFVKTLKVWHFQLSLKTLDVNLRSSIIIIIIIIYGQFIIKRCKWWFGPSHQGRFHIFNDDGQRVQLAQPKLPAPPYICMYRLLPTTTDLERMDSLVSRLYANNLCPRLLHNWIQRHRKEMNPDCQAQDQLNTS